MKEFKYIIVAFSISLVSLFLVGITYPEQIANYAVCSGMILLALVLWLKITKYQLNFFFVLVYTLINLNFLNLILMGMSILINALSYTLGFVLSVVISIICKKKKFSYKFLKWLSLSSIIVIFLVLLVAPSSMIHQVNQTRAWLKIGNLTLQLTEFVKLLFIVYIVSVVGNDSVDVRNARIKFRELLLSLVILGVGFCLISELGTLLLCILIFCVAIYLFFPRVYFKRMCTLMIACAIVGVVSILLLLKLNDSSLEVLKAAFSLPIHLACKVYDRFYILWNYQNMSDTSYAFQYIRAREALVLASEMPLFRTPITVLNFGYDSDMSFIALVINCGLLYGFLYLVLIFMLIMWFYRTHIYQQDISETNRVLRVLVVVLLFCEIWFGIACSTCLLPIVGLGTPFLSKSGTMAMLTAMLLSSHLIDLKLQTKEDTYEAY